MYKGIDIFSETNVVNWEEVKNSGIQVVYIKATEGVSYVNPIMVSQYNGAKNAGLLVGFYHFASTNSMLAQYNHFMSTINDYNQDVKPCLDYEINNADYGFINQFMAQNSNLIFYSYHYIADNCGVPTSKIWIAEPGTSPVTTKGYVGIQYSWTGKVNGITNNDVDFNLFDNSILNNGNNSIINPVFIIQSQLNVMTKAGLVTDGIMGPKTIGKIKQFQEIVGITIDGIWGPECANATSKIYSMPLCGIPYRQPIPTRLIQFRMGIAIDGIYWTQTEASVKRWQSANGLVPDGIFGPLSWGKLLS